MATNPVQHSGPPITPTETPAASTTPPPVAADAKNAVKAAAAASASASGDATGSAPKAKSAKELEKEKKKAEKLAKFQAKQAASKDKSAAPVSPKEKKVKPGKVAAEPVPKYVEDTPAGEKKKIKPFDHPNFKAYDPIAVESAWYEWWEKEGFFKPEFTADGKVKDKGNFVIVHPPPNVTGALHMGHGLGDSLQDVMVRWNRMQGKTVLWLPGCDHAGISTQSVVENMLWRKEQKTRHDLGRTKFVETVWDWKDEYHKRINNALRKLGGSFDWSREAFTMDANLSAAVAETFVQLHEEGIIYRANRLVNWCTKLNTALSNLEVVQKELNGRTLLEVPGYDKKVEFGIIVHFKYKIEGTGETIEVATTRIETMLGDTGIAVHPQDERYKHLVGKNAVHPFIPDRKMPIIADDYVDKEFGTGAVKITPAHDPNDFSLGQRHNLEFINILTDDGAMNENAGPYRGQRRFDVRYTIQDDLKKLGLYVGKKDNPMKVPLCDKSKDIIEPIMKPQWWVRMKEMASEALKVVQDGQIRIQPESARKSYYRWMGDVNDWCISRQLWWGHQCPVYFASIEGEESDQSDNSRWFSGKTQEEAEEKAKKALGDKKFSLTRDEDVLDTWFSSGLWPFSTLGWPKTTDDLEKLFPTSVLETGWDILFFWIARMVMLSLKMTGKIPFKEVYCHSLVRDSEGRKMSKSLGNVVDPLDVIYGIKLDDLHAKLAQGNLHPGEVEKATKYQKSAFPQGIPQCGADALRFCMIAYTTGGGDINFDIQVMHGYRRFCNKIYQATKYVLGNLPADYVPPKSNKKTGKESLAERWILHKMTIAAREINEALTDREFMKSTMIVYQYWYAALCDVFIENSKAIIQDGTEEQKRSARDTLYTALESALTMIHPFMPFITEELWQRLPRRPEDKTRSIMLASYPTYDAEMDDPASEAAYELLTECSRGVRSLMSEYAVKDGARVFVQAFTDTAFKTASEQLQAIQSLSGKGVAEVQILDVSAKRPLGCVTFPISSEAAVFLYVKGRVDMDAEIEKAQKKLVKTKGFLQKQQKILNDPAYKSKVPAETQETDQKKVLDLELEAKNFESTIAQFEQLKMETTGLALWLALAMASTPIIDRLPDEILQLILYEAMREESPLYLEYCLDSWNRQYMPPPSSVNPDPTPMPLFPDGPASRTRSNLKRKRQHSISVVDLDDSSSETNNNWDGGGTTRVVRRRDHFVDQYQAAHLKDWLCANSTCRRFRRLGKEQFFAAKTFAMSTHFPKRLSNYGDSSPFKLSDADKKLFLERVEHVVIVDNNAYSPRQLMELPKSVGAFSRLKRCTLLFGFRTGDAGELIISAVNGPRALHRWKVRSDAEESPEIEPRADAGTGTGTPHHENREAGGNEPKSHQLIEMPEALGQLLVGIGVSRTLKMDIAVSLDSVWNRYLSWNKQLSSLVQNIYPILRFRVHVLARSQADRKASKVQKS
ncbi:hypothetical protein MKZ38_005009 [Zalerion maritima]|uniref:Valine--tRNA ligase, mitochondrial n=1 Tax=Zalerion maritima TaxID=339359 RepID=A0AAD5WQN4_9PEZI|nr:hypothetical protein MKZ38_005009 [Zalerion maritima]